MWSFRMFASFVQVGSKHINRFWHSIWITSAPRLNKDLVCASVTKWIAAGGQRTYFIGIQIKGPWQMPILDRKLFNINQIKRKDTLRKQSEKGFNWLLNLFDTLVYIVWNAFSSFRTYFKCSSVSKTENQSSSNALKWKLIEWIDKVSHLVPSLLTWIDFNPSTDKWSHVKQSVEWDYLSIPNPQRLHHWGLVMDK